MAPTLATMTESREERIEKLHEFLDTYSSTTLLVTVSDPFKSRRFLRTKRMFHVTTLDPTGEPGEDQWSVERSFDDFVLLRRTLQNHFPGILIAELPEDETHDMFKSTESKLNKQSETLTHWVMHVSRHPFASIDAVFLIFLSGASKFSDAIKSLVDRKDMSQLAPAYKSKMLSKLTAGRARRFFMNTFQRSPTTALEKLAHEETSHHGRYLQDNENFTTSAQWWWHEALEVAEEPADAAGLAQGVVQEIARIKTSMKECKAVLLGLAMSHKTSAGAYDVLAKTIGGWLGAEYAKDLLGTTDPVQNQTLQEEAGPEEDESGESSSTSQPSRGGVARPSTLPIIMAATKGDESDFISMPSALTRAVRRLKRQARTEKQLSENALITLIAAIRFEMLYLDTLREAVLDAESRLDDESTLAKMLRSRERKVQTLENHHRTHEMIYSNYPENGREPSADATERGYAKAKAERDEFAAKAEPAYHVSSLAKRATLSVELSYFRTERVLRIATFLQEFSDVHAQFGETTSALWGGVGTVGAFPMSAMERMQVLQQEPLAKKSRSLYAVLPPKPPISLAGRRQLREQQQQQQQATQQVVETEPRARVQAVHEQPVGAAGKEEEGVTTTTQQQQPPQPQPQQQQQLLEGAPTTTERDGVRHERETAVNEMTLAEARAIIAKYKYGGAAITKIPEEEEEEEEKEEPKSRRPSASRAVAIPSKYAGMYKKRVTPGKRLNRDVQMDHDFRAENSDELTVRRGEILKGLRFADEDTAQWLVVENSQGRRGVVPVGLLSVFSSSDEEGGEEEQKFSSRPRARRVSTDSSSSTSRYVVVPNKYAGMYKKRVTPNKRVNRDVQMDHDFEAETPDELSARRGEILRGLRFADEDTAQWLVVENSRGRRGVVPVSFVSVFSSSDEEGGEEEQRRVSQPRARRVSTQSTAASEPSEWQQQQRPQQQQQQPQQQEGDSEWRRENEKLRKQLEEMREEMQSLKTTTTRAQPQQQEEKEEPEKQPPPPQTSSQKAFWLQTSVPQGSRGVYTEDNATAMGEAFQRHETGVGPKLQQQPQQLQPQQRPKVLPIPVQIPQQREQDFQQQPPQQEQQQQQPSIRRERAQGEEDSWVQQQQPQPQQQIAQQEQEPEESQGKSEKKRSGMLRWILGGGGGKDKGQQQQQQQHAPPTEAPEEAEDEEGKREESTSGEGGRTAALFVNKAPLQGGGKTEYAPKPATASEIPSGEQEKQQQEEQPQQQQQQQQPQQQQEEPQKNVEQEQASSSSADEAANWVQGFDPKYQRNFYFNTRTKESTWNKPASWRVGGGKTSATAQEQQQFQQQPMMTA